MPYRLDIPGWMLEGDLRFIETLARHVPEHGRMIEVGSFCGRSTWAWAKSIPASATVHCIDPWEGFRISADSLEKLNHFTPGVETHELRHFLAYTQDCPNISYTQDISDRVLPTLQEASYDLIFLDGVHYNPTFSDDLWRANVLLKDGGILCGHDFCPFFADIVESTKYMAALHDRPLWFALNSTIWMMIKS